MSWVAWAAVGCWAASIGCFIRGGFAVASDGMPWMFCCFVLGAVGLAFTLAAVFR